MSALSSVLVRFTADISDLQRQLNSAQQSVSDVGTKLTSIGKTLSLAVTTPLTALGTAVVAVGSNFDATMSKVQAVTGATGGEMDKLTAQAKDLGSTTQFSATQAAEAMTFLGQAGYTTNDIMKAMPGLLSMAAAGAVDLGTAADIASNILSGFGMSADKTAHVADVLAKSAAASNTDIQGLGLAFSYIAPIASAAGMSVEEMSAAIGLLSNAGIKGEKAGTALRGIISQLLNPTTRTTDALAKMGLTFDDVNPQTHSLAEILTTLKGAGIDTATAMELVGIEAGPGLLALLQQGGDGLEQFTKELENSDGAAKKMADTITNNTKGGFIELSSAVEGLMLSFYDVMRPAIETVTELVLKLTRTFSGFSPEVKTVIAIVAALAVAIGPVLVVMGLLVTAFTAVTLPMAGIAAGVTALIMVLGTLYAKSDEIAAFLKKSWAELENKAGETWDAIKDTVSKAWDDTKAFTETGWEAIKSSIQTAWKAISDVTNTSAESVKNVVQNGWDAVKSVTDTVWNGIKTMLQSIWDFIKQMFQNDLNWTKSTVETAWNAIKSTTETVWNAIKSFLQSTWNSIKQLTDTTLNNLKALIQNAWNAIKSNTEQVYNTIKSFLQTTWNSIKQLIQTTIDAIKQLIQTAWSNIQSNTTSVWNSVKSFLSSTWTAIKTDVSNAWNSIKTTISDAINSAKSTVTNAVDSMKSALNSVLDTIKNVLQKAQDAYDKAKSLASKAASKAADAARSSASAAKGTVSGGSSKNNGNPPGYANGGIFTGASNIIIGEAGPEAAIPLQGNRMRPFAAEIANQMQQAGGGGGVNINVQQMVVREEADIERIAAELYRLTKRSQRAKGVL
ncbi:phage tail tape measure protein, TP901 family, core region [Desulfotomaculum arcticum]|uniref:Phage tail tape measure protein, TP901 family, core region n=1 Tax=Desulfotruncus arcticus DSM 17038 TaxID=1121424 RepID=A0A1I2YB35_9FIRM|nr:phage tail tape measure protein [Desulfotruncus arcticus]SFH22934.1 phage tail tape measure protein, TP901 family, core region [Desulfotomaculum arcticum] [Desulfotruncus arcticus DSM 17038]